MKKIHFIFVNVNNNSYLCTQIYVSLKNFRLMEEPFKITLGLLCLFIATVLSLILCYRIKTVKNRVLMALLVGYLLGVSNMLFLTL